MQVTQKIEYKKAIGQKIVELRKEVDMNQQEFAEFLKVSQGNMSRIETGKQFLGLNQIVRICRAFEIEPNHLLLWEQIK